MASFQVLARHLPGTEKKTTNKLSQGRRCLRTESNGAPPNTNQERHRLSQIAG
jgi:hypothetical protein